MFSEPMSDNKALLKGSDETGKEKCIFVASETYT